MKVTIEGTAFDGTYDLDMDVPFNGRELHVVKELAGVRLGEIEEALQAGDYDVFIAFAAIALTRAGKITKDQTIRAARDVLLEADGGNITLEADPEPANPPEQKPSEPPSELGASESSTSSSSDLNGTGDDHLVTLPASTGALG